MKNDKKTVNERVAYKAPDINVANILFEQNILNSGSGTVNDLSDFEPEYW